MPFLTSWTMSTRAYRVLDAASRDYRATPGLFKNDAVLAQEARAKALLKQAAGSLDLSQVRPALLEAVRLEAVLQLKEVLGRTSLPSAEAIPDAEAVRAKGLTRWRIPHTSIDIVQVTEGPQAGEFLFSPETVRQANSFYQRVRHLPYLTEGAEGFYERYNSNPGRLLAPKWLAWVVDMPGWTQRLYYGQTVWQWAAFALTFLVLFSVLYALSRWKRRFGLPDSDIQRILDRLLVPIVALLGLWLARDFLVQQISFTGQGLVIVLKGLLIPATLIEAYIAYLLSVLVAERVISSPRIDAASLDANMIRMVAGVLGIAVGLAILFSGANELGVPLVPLIASLGVGGLAVALAARPTIENLIGGIIPLHRPAGARRRFLPIRGPRRHSRTNWRPVDTDPGAGPHRDYGAQCRLCRHGDHQLGALRQYVDPNHYRSPLRDHARATALCSGQVAGDVCRPSQDWQRYGAGSVRRLRIVVARH